MKRIRNLIIALITQKATAQQERDARVQAYIERIRISLQQNKGRN